MKVRWKKTIWISILCGMLVTFPLSTAWGVGAGTKGADVFAVQGMLTSLGDFKGTITGYYGTQTTSAVKQFQKRYNLAVTGTVDEQTLQSILWAYSQMKITKKPTPKPTYFPTPITTPIPINPNLTTPVPKAPIITPVPKGYPLTGLSAEEEQMIQMVNQARAQAGLQ